jgi:hypothetical protein
LGEVFGLRRVPATLAVALGLLALAACLADPLDSAALHQSGPGGPAADWLITLAVALPGTALGVLLAARRPGNPIGWLLLILLLLTADPADGYAILDYRLHHGTLPLGWVAVLFLAGPLVSVLMAITLWLFPDGRLPAGRWHRVSVALVTAGLLPGCSPGSCCWRPACCRSRHRWRWPSRRWPPRRCSIRYGGGSSTRWTAGSTGRGTTPSQWWPGSPRGWARPWISMPSRASS